MRIIGFSKKWDKLNKQWFAPNLQTFTTFRFPRKDRDWDVEELVQVVYKPRSKEREPLGIARIIRKQEKDIGKKYYQFAGVCKDLDVITPDDAYEDGFSGMHGGGDIKKLLDFLRETSTYEQYYRVGKVNKLTLYWLENEISKTVSIQKL